MKTLQELCVFAARELAAVTAMITVNPNMDKSAISFKMSTTIHLIKYVLSTELTCDEFVYADYNTLCLCDLTDGPRVNSKQLFMIVPTYLLLVLPDNIPLYRIDDLDVPLEDNELIPYPLSHWGDKVDLHSASYAILTDHPADTSEAVWGI